MFALRTEGRRAEDRHGSPTVQEIKDLALYSQKARIQRRSPRGPVGYVVSIR